MENLDGYCTQLTVVADNSDTFSIESELRPFIPPGEYHFKLINHYTARMFGGNPKLILTLSVIDNGEYQSVKLCRYYNVKKVLGKSGKKGRFVPPIGGDFMIDYFTLVPGRLDRADRLSFAPLYNSIILGQVETVTKNSLGKALPKELHSSKVSKLIKLKEDLPFP